MLNQLIIENVRKIKSLHKNLSPSFNIIVGKNGSGKTSILEAIHTLALGRSFRTHMSSRLIHHDADHLTVHAHLPQFGSIGVSKPRNGKTTIKLNNDNTCRTADLAKTLPLQLIDPHSYRLFEGGSKNRRQFLDWSVFHVEHAFLQSWRRYQRALKHRNALLRADAIPKEIKLWDQACLQEAIHIDKMRRDTLVHLEAVFTEVCEKLLPEPVFIEFSPGWKEELGLEKCLEQNLMRDKALGYTQSGPHRADLKFLVGDKPAVDILSRGQQKLAVSALHIAQGRLLQKLKERRCIYLIDDFNAELDADNQKLLLTQLQDLDAQVFIATTDLGSVQQVEVLPDTKVFHVKQGEVVNRSAKQSSEQTR